MLGAARSREQSPNQSREQLRAATAALEPSAEEEPCAVTTGVTCPCHVPRVPLRLLAGTNRATRGAGATRAKGWKGEQQSSVMGSARAPRGRDLSEGAELISGLNLVQRVPAAAWEGCHVGMDALEQHFVGQATRILLLMLKIFRAE